MIARTRFAYTYIEMVAAIVASTLLLVALASTVAISTAVVETDDAVGRRDQWIEARMKHDLRYATEIDTGAGDSFVIQRTNLESTIESVNYRSQTGGWIRQVSGQAAVTLDDVSPTILHAVDGYTAATESSSRIRPRVRDVSSAATDGGATSSIEIDIPDGARPGDLLILVTCYRNSIFVFPWTSEWSIINLAGNVDVGVIVRWQIMTESTPRTHGLGFSYGGDVAAAMIAIEYPNESWPFGWSGAQTGSSIVGNEVTYPQPVQNTQSINDRTLNLQFYGSSGWPLPDHTLGVSSMTDCVNLVGSPATGEECSLGVSLRHGPLPAMTTLPRVWHRQSVNWVTIGLEVEGKDAP